ncbi:hypothetical protein SAMN05216359_102484 [Roseateles sp. YR242]|uniref:hypothetical protein n=1 Tax=Roseateles sp. YR242 TaxID=1855305 RepID=UPI0008C5AFAF|nr:hypothetical protein [Roseateles sp. YR242]SEK63588.1 hypothetical protein SAMN05216359_102484 [Roseateles sp. YR242]
MHAIFQAVRRPGAVPPPAADTRRSGFVSAGSASVGPSRAAPAPRVPSVIPEAIIRGRAHIGAAQAVVGLVAGTTAAQATYQFLTARPRLRETVVMGLSTVTLTLLEQVRALLNRAAENNHLYHLERGPTSPQVTNLVADLLGKLPDDALDEALSYLVKSWNRIGPLLFRLHETGSDAVSAVNELAADQGLTRRLGVPALREDQIQNTLGDVLDLAQLLAHGNEAQSMPVIQEHQYMNVRVMVQSLRNAAPQWFFWVSKAPNLRVDGGLETAVFKAMLPHLDADTSEVTGALVVANRLRQSDS